ncbi:VOC family protein [Cohnella boryungensis]|uniref:VOC family protein n=1 Tax=Cohnella boryungensis TaxID=768479 RepID=A0ABV8SC50_9BACL
MALTAQKIFLNLAVSDLDKTMAFYRAVGFEFNAQFTDQNAACMIVSEDIFVMLLVKDFFKTFTGKELADPSVTTEAIVAISADSREQVDEIADKALAAGGKPSNPPTDHGFMYVRSFQDLDGHLWEIMYMDQSAIAQE